MEFNKIIRGNNRQANTEESVYEILDASFLCNIAFTINGQACQIPTSYGRKGDRLFFHGSAKSQMLLEAVKNEQICVSVTHLDGIVLAKTLFNTSANYRSVVLFGKAKLIEKDEERMEALKIITENIIPGRWAEVKLGDENQIRATMVIEFQIERASAKIRAEGPAGDENDGDQKVWSGHIPIRQVAEAPIADPKFEVYPETDSVKNFYQKNKF